MTGVQTCALPICQRPALAAQLLGDRRMTPEGADAGIEALRHRLPDIPVWNQGQSVGRVTPFTVELTGNQLILTLENPAEQADCAVFRGISLHVH